ncbi:MAG: hypothetical protein FWC09_03575 [Lachnospiraceae bacterium]|nr:hypothetical protein [Lachnospiraceae bacterium]
MKNKKEICLWIGIFFILFQIMMEKLNEHSIIILSIKYSSIIYLINYILIFIGSIYIFIHHYSDLRKQEDIFKRGILIHGNIESIIFRGTKKSLISGRQIVPIVSFQWQGITYKYQTLTSIPPKKYKKGDEVELLFLPEYPDKVVQKNESPLSPRGTYFLAIVFFITSVRALVIYSRNF